MSRLMRRMDFGAVFDDGSIIVAFAETDLRPRIRSRGDCRA